MSMTSLRTTFLALTMAAAAAAQTTSLVSGVPRRFSISAQAGPFTLTGITIAAPPGTSRLTIDLEADNLAHDVNLYARFDRDVGVADGAVTARDFASVIPAFGREQIVVSPSSSPPLQSGTYYLAIGVATFGTAISGTIKATVDGGGSLGTLILSTFEFDGEGWSRNFPTSSIAGSNLGDPGAFSNWESAGGNPDGYFSLSEPDGARQDFAVAPPKFLGNLAALTNPRLEFDYRHTAGAAAIFRLTVRLLGAGSAFEWNSSSPPPSAWTHFRVALDASTFQRTAGAASLAQAFANVERLEISMDQTAGAESNGIDNFALIGDLASPRTLPAPAPPVISSFDNDVDGWSRNYPPAGLRGASFGDSASAIGWSRTGGNPGGALVLTDAGGPTNDFFVAPTKFLGNLSALENPRLEFDYRHSSDLAGALPLVVRLAGAGSSFLWIGAIPDPLGGYQHYRIPLAVNHFVPESGSATFAQALAAVERLEISADQSPDPETNTLDNVALLTSPVVLPILSVGPLRLTYTATAGASDPAPQAIRISSSGDSPLAWTATVNPPGAWLTLSATGGVTPAVPTAVVTIVNLVPGVYNGTITITAPGAANSPQTVAVALTVEAVPPPVPRINAGGIVNAASFRVPLAAGSLATLFGANLGPAEGVSTPYLPGTQTLPTRFVGVRVLVRDPSGAQIAEAPLLHISRIQINFQMPFETSGRTSVLVAVDNNGIVSAAEPATLAATAPGLFAHGANRAVAQNQDFSLNQPALPAPRGGVLFAYLTGQGSVVPPVPTGQAAPVSPLSAATAAPTATIGGVPATVLFLGLTPGLVGLAQANILVPDSAPLGEQVLLITIGSQPANGAIVSIGQP